jgi:hypothetical protein
VKVVGVGLLVVADATGVSSKRLSATTPNASDAVLLCICDFFDLMGSLRFILGTDLISDNFRFGFAFLRYYDPRTQENTIGIFYIFASRYPRTSIYSWIAKDNPATINPKQLESLRIEANNQLKQ